MDKATTPTSFPRRRESPHASRKVKVKDMPWPDTWDGEYQVGTPRQYALMRKQKCKDMWLVMVKYGRSIMKMTHWEVIDECTKLEREAQGWEEELEWIWQEQERIKWERDIKNEEKAINDVKFERFCQQRVNTGVQLSLDQLLPSNN